jgi:UDP-glucose 4-epimerase
VIITGGNGFLGRHLVPLLKNQHRVLVVDLAEMPEVGAETEVCDISNSDSLSDAFDRAKPETVVHLAGVTGVQTCREKPLESFLVNVVGTFNVAWLSALYGSRLVFASSREVYGETVGTRSSENARLKPNNLYGLTKLVGESIVGWIGDTMGLRYVILRLTNLYGPGGDKYAVAALIKKAIRDEEIPVLGGDQVLNLIHVRDATRAIRNCILKSNMNREILNIGSTDTIRVSHLIDRIVSLTGSRSKTCSMPMRMGETVFFDPDISKASLQIDFRPTVNLSDGLIECIEYYRSQLTR